MPVVSARFDAPWDLQQNAVRCPFARNMKACVHASSAVQEAAKIMAQQKATDAGDAEGASPQAELLDALIASVHRTNVHFDPQKNAPESIFACGVQ